MVFCFTVYPDSSARIPSASFDLLVEEVAATSLSSGFSLSEIDSGVNNVCLLLYLSAESGINSFASKASATA